MTSGLLIAQLALYAPLTLPTLYLLYRHGHHGLLAWLYLLAFCVLRVTGAAMGLNDPHNAGSRIISSIGLSPLLLSIDGVLHEARIYCLSPSKRTEWTFMALIHVLVATGVAMVGVGAGGLLGDTPKPSDLSNIKVGMVLLEVSWGVLALWGLWTLWNGTGGGRKSARNQGAQAGLAAREGWLLLTGNLLALALVEISVVYMLVAEFTQRADLNPTTGSLAVRVVLGFCPELLAAIVLVFAGFVTRGAGEALEPETWDSVAFEVTLAFAFALCWAEWAGIRIEMGGYLLLYGALYAARRQAFYNQVYHSSSA
ncbi:hypothetical protein KXV70_004889 [Aspergillus fumigatus]|nr:hypothetical protein KXX64_006155 [Aspergillus fumigatus]KAH1423189.1 hypothetical protein KXX32_007394 [Aspergillus fumigatus]KAH1544853.1 hypothetical protein KXX57_005183 [Aspergillus fumigatus]KAH1593186.1 hypothetical protein KXX44_008194 [Aspergillus fumigatus]KAH2215447.1 hypothetical protein KXW71_003047 [Aspergillus fumigatus]